MESEELEGLEEKKEAKDEGKQKKPESRTSHVIRFVIIAVLAVGILLAIYIRMMDQSPNSASQAEENMTELEILKQYDFDSQYPKMVRDVVKMHCRLLKCMYNENLDDNGLNQLNEQVRKLLSDDLLGENEENEQFLDLKNEVAEFQDAGKIFISYTIDPEDSIQYSEVDGIEYATIYVTCNIKEGTTTNAIQEQYLLVKENNQWKILGWQGIVEEDSESEDEAGQDAATE